MGNEPSNGTKEYPYGTYNGGLARDVLAFGPIQREGYGEMKWNDGAVYRGYWKKNEMDGPNGTLTFPNGNVYTGDFYKNNPHGNGILTTGMLVILFIIFVHYFLLKERESKTCSCNCCCYSYSYSGSSCCYYG